MQHSCSYCFLVTYQLETVDKNLLLTVGFINQKGQLLESKVKLEVIKNIQQLENEMLYAFLTKTSEEI